MIKLRHLRASCADLFCVFKLTKDDYTRWIVQRFDHHSKCYKCYCIDDPSMTLLVPQETLVYEAAI